MLKAKLALSGANAEPVNSSFKKPQERVQADVRGSE